MFVVNNDGSQLENKRFCKCGCNEPIAFKDKWGRIREFKRGHSTRLREVKCLNAEKLRGENHHMWKGGRLKKGSYVYILKPDHPFADHLGYVAEHRLVMEKYLGRYLSKDEDVHHINGDREDNRIKNLQPIIHRAHLKHHSKFRQRDSFGRFIK